MPGLREQLEALLTGRVCVVGVGNVGQGDDALGMCLAEQLAGAGVEPVLFAGTEPERLLDAIAATGCERVLFLDATDFRGRPGSVVLLETDEITARYPQVSTHKLSLGLLARLIESDGRRKVGLLGVQPRTVAQGGGGAAAMRWGNDAVCALSEPVQRTVEALAELLGGLLVKSGGSSRPRAVQPAMEVMR